MLLPSLFGYVFFAILFLQSGIDKATNFQSNLSWLSSHFSKTIFSASVKLLLVLLMIGEITSGLLSLFSVLPLLQRDSSSVLILASLMINGITLLMLFTGQRIAKDYNGAAVIAAYFAVYLVHTWMVFECFKP